MKNVEILTRTIPSKPRSDNYSVGGAVINTGGGTSSSGSDPTKLDKSVWDANFEELTDPNGAEYLYLTKPIVMAAGATMYAGSDILVPSIFEGLPLDQTTIGWNNGRLSILGNIGGGISSAPVTGSGNAITSATLSADGKVLSLIKGATFLTEHQSLAGYAKTSDIPSLVGYVTESWVNNKGYLVASSQDKTNWNDAFGWGDHATAGYAKTSALADYVTLATKQEITGAKTFAADITAFKGITIGGISVKKSEDGVLILDGNLLITGGVTIHALGSRSAATIMDGVVVDGTTIVKQDGKLVALGGGSSVDMTTVWTALASTTSEQINVSHIPSLDWAKIGSGKPTTLAGYGITDALPLTGGTVTGYLEAPNFAANVNGVHAQKALYLPDTTGQPTGAATRPRIGRFDRAAGATVLQLGTANKFEIVDSSWNKVVFSLSGTEEPVFRVNKNALNVDSTIADIGVRIRQSGVSKAYFGWNTTYGTYLYNYSNTCVLNITDGGVAQFNYNTLLHAGNYNTYVPSLTGAGASGTWAINITGTSKFADRAKGFNWTGVNSWDCNNPSYMMYSDYGSAGKSILNTPIGWNYGALFTMPRFDSYTDSLNMQLIWDVQHNTTESGKLWFRTKDSIKGWKGWAQIAKVTDNVASATQLLNTRTIFGQPFNGTADIPISADGKMTFLHFKNYNDNGNAGYVGRGGSSSNQLQLASYNNNSIVIDAGISVISAISTLCVSSKTNNFTEGIRLYGTAKNSTWSNIQFGCDPNRLEGTHANQWTMGRSSTNNFILDRNNPVSDGTNGFVVTTAGNMGIGTSAPGAKLHIVGTLYTSSNIESGNSITSGGWYYAPTANGYYINGGVYYRSIGTLYPDIVSAGNEICFGSTSQDLFINYRKSNGGVAVNNFLFKNGTSTGFANIYCGNVISSGTITAATSITAGSLSISGNIAAGRIYTSNYNNTNYNMSTDSFICNSWIRTNGSTGWYNETYGGGIYATDGLQVRVYGNKVFYNDGYRVWGISGHNVGLKLYQASHIGINLANASYTWGIYSNNNGNLYFGRRNGDVNDTSGSYYYVFGAGLLSITGNLLLSGGATMHGSDITKKNVLSRFVLPLNQIANAPLIRYRWKDNRNNRINVGGSAQYTNNLLPECAYKIGDTWSMDYETTAYAFAVSTAVHLANYIKTQATKEGARDIEIRDLKRRIEILERRIA